MAAGLGHCAAAGTHVPLPLRDTMAADSTTIVIQLLPQAGASDPRSTAAAARQEGRSSARLRRRGCGGQVGGVWGARLHPGAARAPSHTAWARQAPCSASKLPLGCKRDWRAAAGAHLPITRLRSIAARCRRGGGLDSSQAVAAERWAPFHAALGH